MECENYFCVYQEDGRCVLTSVRLDVQGRCKACIYLPLDDKLKDLKAEVRIKYNEEA